MILKKIIRILDSLQISIRLQEAETEISVLNCNKSDKNHSHKIEDIDGLAVLLKQLIHEKRKNPPSEGRGVTAPQRRDLALA